MSAAPKPSGSTSAVLLLGPAGVRALLGYSLEPLSATLTNGPAPVPMSVPAPVPVPLPVDGEVVGEGRGKRKRRKSSRLREFQTPELRQQPPTPTRPPTRRKVPRRTARGPAADAVVVSNMVADLKHTVLQLKQEVLALAGKRPVAKRRCSSEARPLTALQMQKLQGALTSLGGDAMLVALEILGVQVPVHEEGGDFEISVDFDGKAPAVLRRLQAFIRDCKRKMGPTVVQQLKAGILRWQTVRQIFL